MRMPRSHSITFGLPSLRMYSAAISSSSSVADRPRLSSTGLPGAADLGQQRVVLHVARADLDHVGDLEHRLEVARVHQLGDDRQPGLGLGLGEQPQALLPEPLEGVRRGARLVGAAAEHRRAGRRRPRARSSSVWSRDSTVHGPGDQREVLAADLAPVDLDARCARRGVICARGELVGLEDRHDLLDAGCALEAEPLRRARGRRSRRSRSPPRRATGARARRTVSIRSMTAWISSSVAVAFITIIICVLLRNLRLGHSTVRRGWAARRRSVPRARVRRTAHVAGRAPS